VVDKMKVRIVLEFFDKEGYEIPPMYKYLDARIKGQLFCVFCGTRITGFKDELSVREYDLSGACQVCQDKIFEKKND
jgi:hypothetical protein